MDVQRQMGEHPLVIGLDIRRLPAGRVAWILVGIEALLYPFTLYLGLTASDRLVQLLQFGWWGALSPLVALEFGILGALILRRHPGHGIGLVAVAGSLCLALSAFAGAYAAYSLTPGHALPAAGFAEWQVAVEALEATRVGGRGRDREPADLGVAQPGDVWFFDRRRSLSDGGLVIRPADHAVWRAVDPPPLCSGGRGGTPFPQIAG
jgi:hypothetical protein